MHNVFDICKVTFSKGAVYCQSQDAVLTLTTLSLLCEFKFSVMSLKQKCYDEFLIRPSLT